ncbi:tyrosine-protein kinase Shark-like isoform X1 [Macrobrachium nipponense]|uniref:tyrosine-protein kinase Shark-like isoform X1 n=2 Tax=Macrobrachium nipponense TaxID=159736 RepID=UPI0030C84021
MASSASRSEVDDDRWFFGKITAEEANEILAEEGGEEGTFLVRESCSSPGNYVLSFITEALPLHILIRKYHEDAFFSLVLENEPPVFHGLDSLINYYCQNPVGESSTVLIRSCCGEPLPAEVRLHGSSSLLHRSTSQGNITVVSELLKSGYKKLDDKNNNGQTALHIASVKGHVEITEMLIKASALIEVRDGEGVTPLHLACRHNRPAIVRLLVGFGKADLQARATKTGAVALHEAAENGSVDAAKLLLSFHAPSCPQNKNREIPAFLAKKGGHMECYKLLVNHQCPVPQLPIKSYFHGKIDRSDATERLLSAPEARSGYFLLRQSPRKQDVYVLTLRFENQAYNYEISRKHGLLHIDEGPLFPSVECLVDHHVRFTDGLPCRLVKPVSPPPGTVNEVLSSNTLSISQFQFERLLQGGATRINEDFESSPTSSFESRRVQNPNIVVTQSTPRPASDLIDLHGQGVIFQKTSHSSSSPLHSQTPSRDSLRLDLKSLSIDNPIQNSGSSPTMDGNRTDEILGEIDVNHLSAGQVLGNGEFGSVMKGIWLSPSGDQIEVAIKTLHIDDNVHKESFLKEAEVMMNLNHLYIVKLVGVCHGPPLAMVQELMAMGALLDFLLEHPDQISVDFHLKLWAAQIADGMAYLEQKHFVHRDLAARNILLSSMTLVKISDFGLSRALGGNKDYYTSSKGGKWPLKWCAPESINYGTFTHGSDVWSYGITLWEMYTFGDQPYGELPGFKVVELLEKKDRLPQPEKCPDSVFNLMMQCWSYKPHSRPSFKELATLFRTKPEYANIKPYFK